MSENTKICRKCKVETDRFRPGHGTCRACESQDALARYYKKQGREMPLYRLDTTEYGDPGQIKKVNLQLWTSETFKKEIEAAYAIYIGKHPYTKLSNFILLVLQNGLMNTF